MAMAMAMEACFGSQACVGIPPKIGSVIGNLLGKGHDDVGTKQASNAIVIASG